MTYLLAQSGITDLVGQRIFFVKAAQDVEKPYLVLTKVTGPRESSHDGASGLAHPRFQVSVFAETYAGAKVIALAVQAALEGYQGLMDEVYVDGVFYDDENDFYEDDTKLYHVASDYIIWHGE